MSLPTHKMVIWPTIAILLLFIVACSGTPRPTSDTTSNGTEPEIFASTSEPNNTSQKALNAARNMLGVPYRYGGTDPHGFDCSGLVQYAFSQSGVKLPRTSQEIFRNSQLVNPKDLRPGDLVFFAISSSKVSHVGIYSDHDRFIHSPSSGKGVSYASLKNPYWKERLVGVGRF